MLRNLARVLLVTATLGVVSSLWTCAGTDKEKPPDAGGRCGIGACTTPDEECTIERASCTDTCTCTKAKRWSCTDCSHEPPDSSTADAGDDTTDSDTTTDTDGSTTDSSSDAGD